jgi:alanine racemase
MSLLQNPPDLSNITHPNWIEINLDALQNNVRYIRSLIPKSTKILLPVKADSYGHGSLACSYAAKAFGVDFLGVAHITEGILLRQYGIDLDILVLGSCIEEDFPFLTEFKLTASISDKDTAIKFDRYLEKTGCSCKAHIKIDSGMNRYGIKANQLEDILEITELKHLQIEGMFTHLATADMPGNSNTEKQISRFFSVIDFLNSKNKRPAICHCANSPGVLLHPSCHLDMVRPGLALYGYNPMGATPPTCPIKPIMSIKATVRTIHEVPAGDGVSYGQYYVAEKPIKVATIAIGYGDGYLRGEYNSGCVYIKNHQCPILGRVCMDATMVDVSSVPDLQIGDTVDVINGDVNFKISMEMIAEEHHTIPYEITSRVARRLYRKYLWKNQLMRWDDLKKELKIKEFKEYPFR